MTTLIRWVDLPDGVILSSAEDINNAAQVVANAIPEPQAYAIFFCRSGLGLVRGTPSHARVYLYSYASPGPAY